MKIYDIFRALFPGSQQHFTMTTTNNKELKYITIIILEFRREIKTQQQQYENLTLKDMLHAELIIRLIERCE